MISILDQFKKEGKDDEVNGGNPNSASRGNWWEGMTTSMDLLLKDKEMMVFKTNI